MSCARSRRVTHGTPPPTPTTTHKRHRVFSSPSGLLVSRAMVKEPLTGLVVWSTGTALTCRTATILPELWTSMFSATTHHQVSTRTTVTLSITTHPPLAPTTLLPPETTTPSSLPSMLRATTHHTAQVVARQAYLVRARHRPQQLLP